MSYQNRKVIGVWMDKNHAYLISNPDHSNRGDFQEVQKVEVHHHGEHGSSEHVHHHKEIQETQKFFKEISHKIEAFECIYITGPGKVQEEFRNFLQDQHAFRGKMIELGKADHLTREQMTNQVKTHFK